MLMILAFTYLEHFNGNSQDKKKTVKFGSTKVHLLRRADTMVLSKDFHLERTVAV